MWRCLWISSLFINALLPSTSGLLFQDPVTFKCYKGSLDNYEEATLDRPERLISSGCISTNLRTVFFAHGFKSNAKTDTTVAIISGLISYHVPLNVILFDWSYYAYSPNISMIDDAIFYSLRAVPAAIKYGKLWGKSLLRLSDYGLDLNNTILMGFSLSSHMAGYASRETMSEGKEINHIHGIEPSNPLFGDPIPIFTHLSSTDARQVTCTHSDPGYFGTNKFICTSDILMNYGHFVNGDDLQPGCQSRIEQRGCSHIRAPFVVGEALTNPDTVLASGASSYREWVAQNGTGSDIIYIGYFESIINSKGLYFFTTATASPFGEGTEGLKP